MRKYTTVLTVVSLVFFLAACSDAGKRAGTDRPQTNMGDTDLEKAVQDRFNSDPQLSAAGVKIDADAENNQLQLSGTVNSEEIRSRAVELAKNALPGYAITDTIEVHPREMARAETGDESKQQRDAAASRGDSIGESIEDAKIYSQIMAQLSSSGMPYQNIHVDVDKGVVRLHGNVSSSQEKAQVQQVVRQVEGVKQVNNELALGGDQKNRGGMPQAPKYNR